MKAMENLFPLLVLLGSLVVTVTAGLESRKVKPDHPFVGRRSSTASNFYYIASMFYAGSLVFLFLKMMLASILLGVVGILLTSLGFELSRKKS